MSTEQTYKQLFNKHSVEAQLEPKLTPAAVALMATQGAREFTRSKLRYVSPDGLHELITLAIEYGKADQERALDHLATDLNGLAALSLWHYTVDPAAVISLALGQESYTLDQVLTCLIVAPADKGDAIRALIKTVQTDTQSIYKLEPVLMTCGPDER